MAAGARKLGCHGARPHHAGAGPPAGGTLGLV